MTKIMKSRVQIVLTKELQRRLVNFGSLKDEDDTVIVAVLDPVTGEPHGFGFEPLMIEDLDKGIFSIDNSKTWSLLCPNHLDETANMTLPLIEMVAKDHYALHFVPTNIQPEPETDK